MELVPKLGNVRLNLGIKMRPVEQWETEYVVERRVELEIVVKPVSGANRHVLACCSSKKKKSPKKSAQAHLRKTQVRGPWSVVRPFDFPWSNLRSRILQRPSKLEHGQVICMVEGC